MKTILVDAVYVSIIQNDDGNWIQFKELFELLDTYCNPKVIVTNASDDKYELYGLNNLPYSFFTMKHNPDKPDPVYFKTLLEQYTWQPTDVIYFEHDPEAVKSAESVGITSYHYDKDKKDLTALKQFLDQNT